MASLAVSVIVPVRNGGTAFIEQLDALTRQDFEGEWELLVVDNGSTDSSREVAAGYATKLAVRVIDASDGEGPAYARNVGAGHARGEFLAFCDADDVVADDWLRQLYAAAEPNLVVGGAHNTTELNPPDIVEARGAGANGLTELPYGPSGFLKFAGSANLLIPRDLLLELGGWDETLRACEDIDLSWRAQLAGYRLVFASKAIIHYRHRANLSGMYRQQLNYSKWHCEVERRYYPYGLTRTTWRQVGKQWWKIISRSPFLVLGRRRRFVWTSFVAAEFGRIQGLVHRSCAQKADLT